MNRSRPILFVLLLLACTEKVEVTVNEPGSGWEVYGVETIPVTCHPARFVTYVELLIDSVVVGVDSYPSYGFVWDVTSLAEGSVHTVQARATSGSREYLSAELPATVGFRSRLVMDGPGDSIWVYRPNGTRDTEFIPLPGGNPAYPRFRPGCDSIVFIAHHKLYEAAVPSHEAQVLDSIENGIYSCDAAPSGGQVAYEGLPAVTSHLYTRDASGTRNQLTHDSDWVLIDSSRFTCTANSNPVFSPDGARLAYYRTSECFVTGDPHEGETRQDAFIVNSNGASPVNLTAAVDDGYFSGFTWTFDGRWVLFREGASTSPERVLAANLNGHALVVSGLEPVAMVCSPTDSTLIYISTESEHRLYSARLAWTEDTLYVNGPASLLSSDSFDKFLDWVEYGQ